MRNSHPSHSFFEKIIFLLNCSCSGFIFYLFMWACKHLQGVFCCFFLTKPAKHLSKHIKKPLTSTVSTIMANAHLPVMLYSIEITLKINKDLNKWCHSESHFLLWHSEAKPSLPLSLGYFRLFKVGLYLPTVIVLHKVDCSLLDWRSRQDGQHQS